jgi:hypothetical protein
MARPQNVYWISDDKVYCIRLSTRGLLPLYRTGTAPDWSIPPPGFYRNATPVRHTDHLAGNLMKGNKIQNRCALCLVRRHAVVALLVGAVRPAYVTAD